MCGGCNIWAESAGASLIVARYWWVARQGAKAVAAAESITAESVAAESVSAGATHESGDFVDPMPELTRVV